MMHAVALWMLKSKISSYYVVLSYQAQTLTRSDCESSTLNMQLLDDDNFGHLPLHGQKIKLHDNQSIFVNSGFPNQFC